MAGELQVWGGERGKRKGGEGKREGGRGGRERGGEFG